MRSLLGLLGAIIAYSATPIWGLYALYQMFAQSAPFWSTVGISLFGLVGQVVIGVLLFVLSFVLVAAKTNKGSKRV